MPTVMITGANRGLGLEFARQYGADGWRVLAACRTPAEATALGQLDGAIEIHPLDVGDHDSITALARRPTSVPAATAARSISPVESWTML